MSDNQPKILIVDDKPANLLALRVLLDPMEAEVIEAGSGNEALAMVLDHDFSLILLDANMPDMSGFEVAELLKGNDATRDIPIIMVTAAYKEQYYRLRAFEAGVLDYIEKPIDDQLLLAKVTTYLEIFRKKKELEWEKQNLEKKVAERTQELWNSERRFRRIFEMAGVGVALVDGRTGKFIRVNHKLCEILGFSEKELCDKTFADITHEEDFPRHLEQMHSLQNGEIEDFSLEKKCYRENGAVIWVRLTVSPNWEPGETPNNHITVIDDITERKMAVEALQESEQRFRQLYEHAPLAYQSLDGDGCLIEANLAWSKILGYRREDVIGKPFGFFLPPDQRALFPGKFEDFKNSGEVHGVEFNMVCQDGTTKYVSFDGRVAMDIKGGFQRTHCLLTDVSERREIERRLRQIQKMESVGELAGGVAHDFNNILAIILGNLEIMNKSLELDERNKKRIQHANRATRRGAELTQRLLAFSRLQTLKPGHVNLGELIKSLMSMLRSTMGEAIAIQNKVPGDLWPILVDEPQLEHALINLAVNARDAMPLGGRLTIDARNVSSVENTADAPPKIHGDHVRLAISDTGTGIPAEIRDRIFDPFFTTKEVGKGSGLGLSMVYGFMKQSEGDLTVSSKVGVGTTLTFFFPKAEGPCKKNPVATDVLPNRTNQRRRILIVEDEPDVREIAVAILAEHGYETIQAGTAAEALERLATEGTIHLLFTDVVLPGGMNGAQLANRAKAHNPNMHVLFTTGYAEKEIVDHNKIISEEALLHKPYKLQQLLKMIGDLLS